MKISLYICLRIKTMLWKFCILNPKNSKSYLRVKFVNLLKSRRIFNIFFCIIARIFISTLNNVNDNNLLFFNVCKQSHFSHIFSHFSHISKSKRCFNVKSSTYFHMKTKILLDFQICVSAPLRIVAKFRS